ncbi:MAG: DNA mismatch repair endonuclease MutL [Bacilli bacterium]|nr:DNA mismatch repair endonuclease MutL [Bacilli bacterium]
MGIIKVMDEMLANKIAAGEVVEKVSSVIKELVENSIDAGGKTIKVELINAGIKEMRVTDDGKGMDSTDALLAFTPHATSKIKNENDLYFINTLGFRGEALPSIASVSEVELNTYAEGESTKILIKGGKLEETGTSNISRGTSITVRNLFYNTPARLKFLKSFYTELNSVVSLIEKMALANPKISFTLKSENKEVIRTSGSGDLLKVIHEIYGYNVSKNMVSIQGENLDYEIHGYVSNINISKSTKNNMTVLVNGRIITNTYITKIIKDAYHTFLAENRYPIVVINIEVDPTLIDVNIHPTKQDIKISKIESLEELLFSLIRNQLNKTDNTFKAYIETPESEEKTETKTIYYDEQPTFKEEKEEPKQVEEQTIDFYISKETLEYDAQIEEKEIEEKTLIQPVGLAMGTYLFANDENNVYMIDIHAANERINYEKYLKELKEQKTNKISLLFPINIELTKNEYMTIIENQELIKNLGIEFEEFGVQTIRVTAHPTWLKEGYETESINKIFDLLVNMGKKFDRIKFNEQLAINLSCKMSVKANTNIGFLEQDILLKRLMKCEFPYTCPHGRPTIIKYTKYELEKLFKRVN